VLGAGMTLTLATVLILKLSHVNFFHAIVLASPVTIPGLGWITGWPVNGRQP